VSRSVAAAEDAVAELAVSTTSRMAQSDAPHAPGPPARRRASAEGAAGSCTRAAEVALRQLSRLFSCSQEEEDDAAGDFLAGTRCWWRAFLPVATLGLFWAVARRVPDPGGVLGVSDGCGDGGGGIFLRLLPWWRCRRLAEISPAAALVDEEVADDAEEEGSRRVASAMLKSFCPLHYLLLL
jgi:hypothetical protein